jgi:hypothetical protein
MKQLARVIDDPTLTFLASSSEYRSQLVLMQSTGDVEMYYGALFYTEISFSYTKFNDGAGVWPSAQSGGMARRRSRFDPKQPPTASIHLDAIFTLAPIAFLGWICALYKSSYFHVGTVS